MYYKVWNHYDLKKISEVYVLTRPLNGSLFSLIATLKALTKQKVVRVSPNIYVFNLLLR